MSGECFASLYDGYGLHYRLAATLTTLDTIWLLRVRTRGVAT